MGMKMTVRGSVVAKTKGNFKDKETGKEINYYQAFIVPEGGEGAEKVSTSEDVFNTLKVPELPVNTFEVEVGSNGKMKLLGQVGPSPVAKPA